MSSPDNDNLPPEPEGPGVHLAPWEKAFDHVFDPIEDFIHRQTTTGLLLMLTTVIALVIANSPLTEGYEHLKHLYGGITLGDWQLKLSLLHWVNDGLMAFFFFIVGLELKREISVGELADPQQAILPIACAVGGMVLPALIYVAFNLGKPTVTGWGAPMATDIAFAIGVLVLLAGRVPKALITFLIALAIVDDLGAVLVIAIFYTAEIATAWLAGAAGVLVLLVVLNLSGVRHVIPYFLLAVLLWYCLLQSGVHATLAGVLGAFTVPVKPKFDPARFSEHVTRLMKTFDDSYSKNRNILLNHELHDTVQTLEDGIHSVQPPLQRLEHMWHLPVSFLVIPVFAIFNAGVPLDADTLVRTLSSPVALGIGAGLLAGKFIGITGTAWMVLKAGISKLPEGTRFSHIAGVSFLAGIGFTMAIFIAELGFAETSDNLLMAKTGILLASTLAGIIGYAWLYLIGENSGNSD